MRATRYRTGQDPRVALFLTNDDVRRLLPMDECVTVLEELFRQESRGTVENLPRQRFRFGRAGATIMGGEVLPDVRTRLSTRTDED